MSRFVLTFHEIDQTQLAVVGGKGAHLGELSRIEGIRVPAGFCVTTDAYSQVIGQVSSIREQLDGAQRELEEVRGSHLVLESEVLRLEQTRNEVRDELAELQSRLFGMLPAIDRVQSAQRELAAALEPEPEVVGDGEAQVEEEALPSRPIGRLMDALDEDGD